MYQYYSVPTGATVTGTYDDSQISKCEIRAKFSIGKSVDRFLDPDYNHHLGNY